jgi:hypothetical protein
VGVADICVIAAVSGRSGKVLWKQAAGSDGMPLEPAASDRGAAIVRGRGRPFVGLGSSHFVRVDLEMATVIRTFSQRVRERGAEDFCLPPLPL